MKKYYQVSIFKNGKKSFTGIVKCTEMPKNCNKYIWFDNIEDAKKQNKF